MGVKIRVLGFRRKVGIPLDAMSSTASLTWAVFAYPNLLPPVWGEHAQ
jgi:hypothetical protein